MEVGMGMSCWILLVSIIVEPVEDRSASGTIKPPVGITYRVQTERVFVHLEHLAPARGGKGAMRDMARQVDSGDTCTVSNILRCI